MTKAPRYILGIESSCDETAVALVEANGRVALNAVASQMELHAPFGGVVPEVAARHHIEACLPLVEEALDVVEGDWNRIERIAVTYAPGLIGCLLVGMETGKTLAWLHNKPLVAVNHLAGHLHATHLTPERGTHLLAEAGELHPVLPEGVESPETDASVRREQAPYPHLGLIVSGGHTSLVRVEAPGRYRTIAQTLDDAAGEAYDKVARILGLGYPGGPLIDNLATTGEPGRFVFTPPMMRRDKPDFSFSGLKTAVLREVELQRAEHGEELPHQVVCDLCTAFQTAAVEALIGKALAAAKRERLNDLVITGGVACNRGLRERAARASADHRWLRVWFPHPALCTDNAAMIAGVAWHLAPLDAQAALTLNAASTMPLET